MVSSQRLLSVERERNPRAIGKERKSCYGQLTVVKDMHTRKAMMAQASDAFITVPGGFWDHGRTYSWVDRIQRADSFVLSKSLNNDSINVIPSIVFELWPSRTKQIHII